MSRTDLQTSDVDARMGVRKIINGMSWRSGVSGSLMPEPVLETMD